MPGGRERTAVPAGPAGRAGGPQGAGGLALLGGARAPVPRGVRDVQGTLLGATGRVRQGGRAGCTRSERAVVE